MTHHFKLRTAALLALLLSTLIVFSSCSMQDFTDSLVNGILGEFLYSENVTESIDQPPVSPEDTTPQRPPEAVDPESTEATKEDDDMGLSFQLSGDRKSYVVKAIGTCEALDIVIPATYRDLPVRSIGESAFERCTRIESVTIPEGVESIKPSAFYGCTALTRVELPSTLKSIGNEAFRFCTSLRVIDLPESLTEIGAAAFMACESIKEIVIPNVSEIPASLFEAASGLESVYIGSTATRIGENAFAACSSLLAVTLPDSLVSIEKCAFQDCELLTEITIPEHVAVLGVRAFDGCSALRKFTFLGNEVYSIGDSLFAGCESLRSMPLPNGITRIPSFCFHDCKGLEYVEIPESVITISEDAFEGCSGITRFMVSYKNENFSVLDGNLYNKDQSVLLRYAPAKTAPTFNLPESVTTVSTSAFEDTTYLITLTIQDTIYRFTWSYGSTSIQKIQYRGNTTQWRNVCRPYPNLSAYGITVICSNGTIG